MKLLEFTNIEAFAARVDDFLMSREAEHCVELGIVSALRQNKPGHRGHAVEQPLLWAVEDDAGAVCAVAMQSVIDRILISRGPIAAMLLIARRLHEITWSGVQINGVVPSIESCVNEFAQLSARDAQRVMQLRIHQLDRVLPPRPVPGRMRPVTESDRDLLIHWTLAFARAVGDNVPDEEGPRMADTLITDHRGWLWELNDEPVALAAHSGWTPHGVRVNYVYTPEANRGHGYASNLVAQLSQHHLDTGRKFVFLHTDLANPTSNSIYQRIGYRAIADSERWDLERTPRAAGSLK
jgi:uncharacterized protein